MATYKDIQGTAVQSLASSTGTNTGQIWYDSTNNNFKLTSVTSSGSWSTGGAIPKQISSGGGGGSQTAAWITGGLQYPGGTKDLSFNYDGSTWTASATLPANKTNIAAAGPQTSGVIWGNAKPGPSNVTFEYDSSAWTAGGTFPTNEKEYPIGMGASQTAALSAGGRGDPPPSGQTAVYNYNGTAWTTNPNSLPAGQYNAVGDGPNTASWFAGGAGPTPNTSMLLFDGEGWTTGGTTNVPHTNTAPGQGFGSQTDALVCGGDAPTQNASEVYDGTSWSVDATMTTARFYGGSGAKSQGNTSTGFVTAGSTPSTSPTHSGATEEYVSAGAPSVVTLTTS